MISYMNKKHLRFTGEAQYSYYVDPKTVPYCKEQIVYGKNNCDFQMLNVESKPKTF